MSNDVIKHVRTKMRNPEKEKLVTKLLEGYTRDGWAMDVIQTVWGGDRKDLNTRKLQQMKSSVFDLLAGHFENEE